MNLYGPPWRDATQGDRNVYAFLMMIRHAEGTADADGYRRMFGGALFDSFADHPRIRHRRRSRGVVIVSTAAGAYQFIARTWDECARALKLPDFSPRAQDFAAVYLVKRRGALDDVVAGRFRDACRKCAREWASLPDSPYGQPTIKLPRAVALFQQYGGELAAAAG